MRHPFFALPTPLSIGHRGCAGEAPENTLASFERALARGAAILESDIHITRDGVPVLIHDPDVDRVTEATGAVNTYSWAELQQFDAGHRFTPDAGKSHPYRERGLRIPSLAQAFEAFPMERFNLELKAPEPEAAASVIDIVLAMGRDERTLLTAGNDEIMTGLRSRLANLPRPIAQGASTADVLSFVQTAIDGGTPAAEPMALQIPADFAGRPLVTEALVEHAHRHDVQVHVWTINDPDEMTALLDLGVDGIVSDFPGRVCEICGARRT